MPPCAEGLAAGQELRPLEEADIGAEVKGVRWVRERKRQA
jgi:hypothetical protein